MPRSTYVVRTTTSIEIKVVHGNGVLLPPLELFFGTVLCGGIRAKHTNSVALSVALVDDGQLDLAASVSSWPMHCAWLYGGQDVGGEAHAARARWSMRVVAVARART